MAFHSRCSRSAVERRLDFQPCRPPSNEQLPARGRPIKPEDHDFGHITFIPSRSWQKCACPLREARACDDSGPRRLSFSLRFDDGILRCFKIHLEKNWSWDRICISDTLGSTSVCRDGVSVEVCGGPLCGHHCWRRNSNVLSMSHSADHTSSMFFTAVYSYFGDGK